MNYMLAAWSFFMFATGWAAAEWAAHLRRAKTVNRSNFEEGMFITTSDGTTLRVVEVRPPQEGEKT